MDYKCYSCASKVKKAKFGDVLKGLGQFAIGTIPIFGDNINKAVGLDDFEAKNKFARGLQGVSKGVQKATSALATTALDVVAPGAGTAAAAIDAGITGMQDKKDSSKSLGLINPRYAQTGGKIKKVPGGKLESLSSTGILATGRKHEKGGIKLDDKVEIEHNEGVHKIDNDVVVSSDSLRDNEDGLTFAEKMTELERKKGKLEMQLKEELAKTGDKTNNTILLLKKKIGEITSQIGLIYGKQELTAMQGGLRDAKGNPNQLSQDIVPGPQNAMYGGDVYKVGGVIKKRQMGGVGTLFGNLFKGTGATTTTGTEVAETTFGSLFKKTAEDGGFNNLNFSGDKQKEKSVEEEKPIMGIPQQPVNINIDNTQPPVEPTSSTAFIYDDAMNKAQNDLEMKSGGWIEKARELIKQRGTEGKCTGSNFGGPDCPPGSRQYNLAVTFKNMAKRKMGGNIDTFMENLITKVSINKLKAGGKIYDQNGYLNSNVYNQNGHLNSNFTNVKKIRGKGGYTSITTKDMAFPIMASTMTGNSKMLFPDTGDYIFGGNVVTERPIKAGMGLTISGNTTAPVNNTMPLSTPINGNPAIPVNPNASSNNVLPGSNNVNPQVVNQVVPATLPNDLHYDKTTGKFVPNDMPKALPITDTSFSDEKINGVVDATNKVQKRMALRNMGIKGAEMATTVAPGLVEGMFQMSQASKDLKKKYSTANRYGDGLSELKNNITNAIPNAAQQTNDNLNANLATTLEAMKNSGERASSSIPGIVSNIVEQGNNLIATTLANTNQQLAQFNEITRKIEDAKAQEDHQTYNQLLQNKQELQNNLKTAIGKSIENLNNYGATYGPEGQKAADDLVLKLLNKMPYFQQNEELMALLGQLNPEVAARYKASQTTQTNTPPPVSEDTTKKKYGGSTFKYSNNVRIKK